jgi:1,4-alpha-glucan branching enzyme
MRAVSLRRIYTKRDCPRFTFTKAETEFMASKKQSAQTTVAEKPAKTAKALKTATAPATEKATQTAEPVSKTTAPKAFTAPQTAKITFALPKEAVQNAETVAVLGDFNNWQNGLALAKQNDGSFKAAVELEKGRSYQYRFLINGEKWENDWAAEAYVPTPFGNYNSVVTA